MTRGGRGLPEVSLGPAMPNTYTPCRWATPETALCPFQGWPAHRAGGLRPSSTPFDTPRRTPLVLRDMKTLSIHGDEIPKWRPLDSKTEFRATGGASEEGGAHFVIGIQVISFMVRWRERDAGVTLSTAFDGRGGRGAWLAQRRNQIPERNFGETVAASAVADAADAAEAAS
jgi:hypothetical protein